VEANLGLTLFPTSLVLSPSHTSSRSGSYVDDNFVQILKWSSASMKLNEIITKRAGGLQNESSIFSVVPDPSPLLGNHKQLHCASTK
jgi:hypothetical protein